MRRAPGFSLLLLLPALGCADSLLPPLTAPQTAQARKLIASFKINPKGPYLQIRWFCNEGKRALGGRPTAYV